MANRSAAAVLLSIAHLIIPLGPVSAFAGQGHGGDQAIIDPIIELQGRHPEIQKYEGFSAWASKHTITAWHDAPFSPDRTRIVVIEGRGDHLYAAQIQYANAVVGHESRAPVATSAAPRTSATVLQAKDIDLHKDGLTKTQAEAQVVTHGSTKVISARPDVQLEKDDWKVTWHVWVGIFGAGRNQEFVILKGHKPELVPAVTIRFEARIKMKPLPITADDTLADDELHHTSAFVQDATQWTVAAKTDDERASIICSNVNHYYCYDDHDPRILAFTWSDTKIRDTNNRQGVCDEFAVIAITCLRSLKIPARQKFIVWQKAGETVLHSCVEYKGAGGWQHMDPTFNVFNDPGYYRRVLKVSKVTVMDADHPQDARSSVLSINQTDCLYDSELNYHDPGDFCIHPHSPGIPNREYSK